MNGQRPTAPQVVTRARRRTVLLSGMRLSHFKTQRLLAQLKRYNNIIKLPRLIKDMGLMDYISPLPNYYIIIKMGTLSQSSDNL